LIAELYQFSIQGPEFTELAEDLQEAFGVYVEKECGVDVDVQSFITMYADYREQEEYVSWMQTAKSVMA
jgi:complement component 1 Q subcomponent-binding protein